MSTFSRGQLIQMLLQSGASPEQAEMYAAIAQGESGLNPGAQGDTSIQDSKWGPSVGLFQVRSLKADYGTGRTRDALRLTDPAFNLASAKTISGGWTNAKPWTVYTSGAYKKYMGGAGAPGGAASSGGGQDMAASAPAPVLNEVDEARKRYGAFASYLDHPQIGPILKQGAREGRDAAWLEGQLTQTDWWKTTAEAARAWELLVKTDPASAHQKRLAMNASIADMAEQLGVTVSAEALGRIHEDALRFGWSAAQLKDAVAAEYRYDPNAVVQGQAAQTLDAIRQLSLDYGAPIDEASMPALMKQVMSGKLDEAGIREYVIEWAKIQFPTIADALDKGITVKQYYQPYANAAAKLLEVSPDTLDLTEEKWRRPLSQVDPKTGARGVQSVWDWEKTLKTDATYNWRYTKNAKEEITGMAQQLSERMGVIK